MLVAVILSPFRLLAQAQGTPALVQQLVDSELAANQNDHSHWIYLEAISKPKEQSLQWVENTEQGDMQRILEKDHQKLSEAQQRALIDQFLHDSGAQKKQFAEKAHDSQQIDQLLKLLPAAFLWTQTSTTAATTSLHFAPAPGFKPPTREARVFASMTADLVADNEQHRIRGMEGRLTSDVTFGGGLLGRLKAGSSFSLEQRQVGPSMWQLTGFHVQLQGNALLFKSISLQQEDQRSAFEQETSATSLTEAASTIMSHSQGAQTADSR